MRRLQTVIITALLLIMVLMMAGCSRPSTSAPVANTPETTTGQNTAPDQAVAPAPDGTAAQQQQPAQDAGSQTQTQPQQPAAGGDKKPAANEPGTPSTAAASLVLGRSQNAQNGEITGIATTFKAGEKFYYKFDNGGPFGTDKLSLQYADPATGTAINQYAIYVDSTSRYDSATMSFKTPGAYKIIILVNGVERASKVVIIE